MLKCRGAGRAVRSTRTQPCPPGTELAGLRAGPADRLGHSVRVAGAESTPEAVARRPRRSSRAAKPDKRKAEADRRTSDAAVVERRHVKDGMSDGEVLARLGPPDLQSGKTGRKMRWTYLPAPGDPQTITLLRFEDGKVVAVERTTMR